VRVRVEQGEGREFQAAVVWHRLWRRQDRTHRKDNRYHH